MDNHVVLVREVSSGRILNRTYGSMTKTAARGVFDQLGAAFAHTTAIEVIWTTEQYLPDYLP